MNEKLPNSMRDVLATQAPTTAHPSADVLAAYMEHSLVEAERKSVASHLAECRECRDVVFVASGAAEEQAFSTVAASGGSTRRRWMPPLVWIGTVAAGLLVVGYFVRDRMATPMRHETLVASNQEAARSEARPAEPQSQSQEPAPPLAIPKAAPVVSRAKAPKRASTSVQNTSAAGPVPSAPPVQIAEAADVRAKVSAPPSSAKANSPAPPADSAKSAAATVAIGGAVPTLGAPAARSNSFATSREAEGAATGELVERSMPLQKSLSPALWRVDGSGHIEHLLADGWTRVLADRPPVFRTVYVRGNSVWAGGDSGTLLHSTDGGAQWKKVALSGENGAEAASVTTIRFSDAQEGVLLTSAGTVYTTSDGGATWIRR